MAVLRCWEGAVSRNCSRISWGYVGCAESRRSTGYGLETRRQLHGFGRLEFKVLQNGDSGKGRQQGLALKSHFLGGCCGLCMECLAAACSAQGSPRSGRSRKSPALRDHRAGTGAARTGVCTVAGTETAVAVLEQLDGAVSPTFPSC